MQKRLALGWRAVLASLLSAALLAGCITTLAPTQILPRGAHASVSEVAIAVGANGHKHYAWTECSGEAETLTCSLVYSRVSTGAVVYSYGFVQLAGSFARYPDVAVNSAGDAYVVWSNCTDFSNCYDYWTVFPATHPENVEPQSELIHSSSVKSEDRPVVVGRALDVYAAYYIIHSGYVALRYRQLNGGSSTGYLDDTKLNPVGVSLAVDSAGDLHAAWVRDSITHTYAVYAYNLAAGGDVTHTTSFDEGHETLVTYPDLALDNDDRAYFAYSINSGINDTIKVRCIDDSMACYQNTQILTVPQVSGGWNVWRQVHLEVINDKPNVVFAATNSSESFYEVWWYRPADTLPDDPPVAVTNTNTKNEGEPLIVEEHSTSADVPVVGWRQWYVPISAQTPSGPIGFCDGDVFVKYASEATRKVFTDRGTCGNEGLDLAANGAWVAGVWVDEDPDVAEFHAAWTDFNARVTYLPLTER